MKQVTLTTYQEQTYNALSNMVDKKTNTFRGVFKYPGLETGPVMFPLKALAEKGLISLNKVGRTPPSEGRKGSIVEAQILVPPSKVHIRVQDKHGSPTRSMYEPVAGEENEPPLGTGTHSLDQWERHWTRKMGNRQFEDDPKAQRPEQPFRNRPWA